MQSTSTILCLGCAQDISSRQDDRRALGSETAQEVIVAWRSMLTNLEWETEEEELCAESLSLMNVDNEKMCRKCFSGFERYCKLTTTLKSNLTRTVQSQHSHLEAQVPIRKRPRVVPALSTLSMASNPPVCEKEGESSSPSVSVS